MGQNSAIEWTDRTWNPTKGCSKVSPGCRHCYAIRMAHRLQAMGHEAYQGTTRTSGGKTNWTGKVNLDKQALFAPLEWKKPSRIFVNSMSDLFHEKIDLLTLRMVFLVMEHTQHHQYQILTKRPEQMARQLGEPAIPVLPNVWLGVSVESAEYADRIAALRMTDAFVRFVSFEPLLGSVRGVDLSHIDWAIVGGESGPSARPMQEEWVQDIHDACLKSGTAFFFKQWGGVRKTPGNRLWQGQEWNEFPKC